jgi:hypothetical protein
VLTRLSRDDGGVQGQQVGLLGHVVDDVEDVADGLDAAAEVRDDRHGLRRGLLDAVDLGDDLDDGLGALLGVDGHLFGQARRLVRVLCTWSISRPSRSWTTTSPRR